MLDIEMYSHNISVKRNNSLGPVVILLDSADHVIKAIFWHFTITCHQNAKCFYLVCSVIKKVMPVSLLLNLKAMKRGLKFGFLSMASLLILKG